MRVMSKPTLPWCRGGGGGWHTLGILLACCLVSCASRIERGAQDGEVADGAAASSGGTGGANASLGGTAGASSGGTQGADAHTEPPPSCGTPSSTFPQPPMGAMVCVRSPTTYPQSAAGTVIEVGSMRGCDDGSKPGWHFVLALEAGTVTVGLGPWTDPRVQVGDFVNVSWGGTNVSGGYTSIAALTVRDQGGQLLFWVGQNAQQTTPPEVTYALGAQLCETVETCGSWERRTLEVTIGAGTATIAPETTAQLGGFEVRVGAVEVETDSFNCLDWWVSNVSLGVFRL